MTFKSITKAVILMAGLTLLAASDRVLAQGAGGPPPRGADAGSVQIKMQIPDLGPAAAQGIDVFSYDFQSIQTTSSAAGGGAGKLEFGPLTVGKRIDALTPAINQRNFNGLHLAEVTIRWFRVDSTGRTSQPILTIKLTDAVVSAVHTRLPNQHDSTVTAQGEIEEVSFTFKDIEITSGT